MLRILIPILFLSSAAYAQDVERACDIRIDFGSYASGIDAAAYEAVMDKILATPAVTEKHITHLGREGERSLCLSIAPSETARVYQELKALIPLESKAGYEKITSRDGDSFQTRFIENIR